MKRDGHRSDMVCSTSEARRGGEGVELAARLIAKHKVAGLTVGTKGMKAAAQPARCELGSGALWVA